ncbi:hypothetical protein GYMLUDRAFT_67842 [Collybiopsis luxurians FD-317 M1]|nr:hypothetical protein GYMLUDRAFT_67842 [Collybiopsis luxurians FD-317 M1]
MIRKAGGDEGIVQQNDRLEESESLRRELSKIKLQKELQFSLPHLPWEILRLIFVRATAPGSLHIPDRSLHSAWNLNLKTKLQLINVCRDWYDAAIGLLYSDIAVYSVGQLSALISTLRAKSHLAQQIASIRFLCYIPRPYVAMFEHIIESLSTLCPNLANLSIPESFTFGGSLSRMAHILSCIGQGALSVTHLEVHDNVPFRLLGENMHLFAPRLVSLSLRSLDSNHSTRSTPTIHRDYLPLALGPEERLQFPQLQTFHSQLECDAMAFICKYWSFPTLKTMACMPLNPFSLPLGIADTLLHSLEFIRKNGTKMKTLFLHFPQQNQILDHTTLMQNALTELPHLRHLIIPPFFNITVPQVQWLDCFVTQVDIRPENTLPLLSAEGRRSRFPSLQSFRIIDKSLICLPLIYASLPPASDECRFQFPGIDIQSNASSLLGTSSADVRWLSPESAEDLDFESGTDSSWEPSQSESESDSDVESDGASVGSGDEFYSHETWTGDEEMALEVWRTPHAPAETDSDSESESPSV